MLNVLKGTPKTTGFCGILPTDSRSRRCMLKGQGFGKTWKRIDGATRPRKERRNIVESHDIRQSSKLQASWPLSTLRNPLKHLNLFKDCMGCFGYLGFALQPSSAVQAALGMRTNVAMLSSVTQLVEKSLMVRTKSRRNALGLRLKVA